MAVALSLKWKSFPSLSLFMQGSDNRVVSLGRFLSADFGGLVIISQHRCHWYRWPWDILYGLEFFDLLYWFKITNHRIIPTTLQSIEEFECALQNFSIQFTVLSFENEFLDEPMFLLRLYTSKHTCWRDCTYTGLWEFWNCVLWWWRYGKGAFNRSCGAWL